MGAQKCQFGIALGRPEPVDSPRCLHGEDEVCSGELPMRVFVLLSPLVVSGCGVVAAPCRVGSAALDMVPLVGHAAATPTDACADAIDPK
jgi:hypothetical protein